MFTWRKEHPRQSGWYWHRFSDQHEPSVLHVFWDQDDGWSVRTGDYADQVNFIENYDGEWSERIPDPVEE